MRFPRKRPCPPCFPTSYKAALLAALLASLLCGSGEASDALYTYDETVAAAERASSSASTDGLRPSGERVDFMHVEQLHGVPRWQLFPYLWMETTLNVTCPGISDFSVYVAKDMDQLKQKYLSGDTAWCGWRWLTATRRSSCVTRISPFGDTFIAAGKPKSSSILSRVLPTAGADCSLVTDTRFNWRLLMQGMAGAALFLWAGDLSTSSPFRLSMGTATFTVGSVIIALFMLSRLLPDRRKVAGVFLLFGGGVMSFAHWLFGSWLPSTDQLMHSKVVWAYLGLSSLLGLTLTYYYDNTENVRLNTIIKVALQVTGLAAVAWSTTYPEVGTALAAGLVGWQMLMTAGQWLSSARQSAAHAVARVRSFFAAGHSVLVRLGLARRTPHVSATHAAHGGHPGQQAAEEEAGEQMQWETGAADGAGRGRAEMAVGEGYGDGWATPTASYAPGARRTEPAGPPHDSPLVQKGLILNEATGRTIQIGKGTYIRLLHDGYTVDRAKGIMTPPPATRSGGKGSGGRSRRSSYGS